MKTFEETEVIKKGVEAGYEKLAPLKNMELSEKAMAQLENCLGKLEYIENADQLADIHCKIDALLNMVAKSKQDQAPVDQQETAE